MDNKNQINKILKKHMLRKIGIQILILILLCGSVAIDLKLIFMGNAYEKQINSIQSENNQNMEVKSLNLELENYEKNFKKINPNFISDTLEVMKNVEFTDVIYNEESMIIRAILIDIDQIEALKSNFEKNGFYMEILSIERRRGYEHIEMDVKRI